MALFNILPCGSCEQDIFVDNPYPSFNAIDAVHNGAISVDVIGVPFIGSWISVYSFAYVLPKFKPFNQTFIAQAEDNANPTSVTFIGFYLISSSVSAVDRNPPFLSIEEFAYAEDGEYTSPAPSDSVTYDTSAGITEFLLNSDTVFYRVFTGEEEDTVISDTLSPDFFAGRIEEYVTYIPAKNSPKITVRIPKKTIEADIVNYDDTRFTREQFAANISIVYGRTSFEIKVYIYKPSLNMEVQLPQDVDFDFSSFTPPLNIDVDTENKKLIIKYCFDTPQRLTLNDTDGNTYYVDIIPTEADHLFFLE